MNNRKHKLLVLSILTGLALAGAGLLWAGAKYNYNVVVGTSYAYGAMSTARYSADTTQYIGCWMNTTNAGCVARNTAGTYKSCYTNNAAVRDTLKFMNDYSYVYFTFDSTGKCTYVYLGSYSYVLP